MQRMGRVADNYSRPCSFTRVGWSGAGVDTSDTPPRSADGRGIAVERLAGLWVCGLGGREYLGGCLWKLHEY